MAANASYSHEEAAGKTGFTGLAFTDRESAAGFPWNFAGEAIAQVDSGRTGADAVRELLAAPYHAALLLNDFRDAGFGWSTVQGFDTLTIDLGTRAGQANASAAGVATYPCEGVADAVAVGGAESPSPFPSDASARWGQPITVHGPLDLAIGAVSITGPTGSVQVQAVYGEGRSPDPNRTGDFTRGTFSIIPTPLQPNTTYEVNISYSTGAGAGQKSFKFSTAPQ